MEASKVEALKVSGTELGFVLPGLFVFHIIWITSRLSSY